jgi:hypothetical protein
MKTLAHRILFLCLMLLPFAHEVPHAVAILYEFCDARLRLRGEGASFTLSALFDGGKYQPSERKPAAAWANFREKR